MTSPAEAAAFRLDMNAYLSDYYIQRTAAAHTMATDYGLLWQQLSDIHAAGGKRLRPYMALLTYRATGGTDYQAFLPIGGAIELVHTALLIHDDIIDRDDTRHGQKNLSGSYKSYYRSLSDNDAQINHYALAAALLGGDVLLSEAYQMVYAADVSAETKIAVCRQLGTAIFAVIGGELLDSEAALRPFADSDSLLIAKLKTAIYSCVVPLQIGAVINKASSPIIEQLGAIGVQVGIAFQLADDLLGIYGDSCQTGKTTTGDIAEGKRTYLMQTALRLARPAEQTRLNAILGRPHPSADQATIVKHIVEACGARQEVEDLMRRYASDATTIVQKLPIADVDKQSLRDCIDHVIWRKV